MKAVFKGAAIAAAVSVLVACGGGGGGGDDGGSADGGGTAGITTLKAGDLDGIYACVGGPYSFQFLTTGKCTDNQIIQGTCTRNVTITGDEYYDYQDASASSLSFNVGVIQGPETKPYYYGKITLGDRLIYERYLPVLKAGEKTGVAIRTDSVYDTLGVEYSLDRNRNLIVTSYGPKPLPRGLTYSSESGGPGEIEVTRKTCNRI